MKTTQDKAVGRLKEAKELLEQSFTDSGGLGTVRRSVRHGRLAFADLASAIDHIGAALGALGENSNEGE